MFSRQQLALPTCWMLTVVLLASAPRAGAQMLYWTGYDTKSIYRSRLDGSNVELVLGPAQGLGDPKHLAVDHVDGKMYWVDFDRIRRANLDGSSMETLLFPVSGVFSHGIDVDVVGRKLYWTDAVGNGAIGRANLDGTGRELIRPLEAYPIGIDVDSVGGKVYWVSSSVSQPGIVRRANLDGTQPETIIEAQGRTIDLAVDSNGQRLFVTDHAFDTVKRASLDGSGLEAIAAKQPFPQGIDYFGGWVYWTEMETRTIWRARPDGADRAMVLAHPDMPRGLAIVVPEPGSCAALLLIVILFRRARPR